MMIFLSSFQQLFLWLIIHQLFSTNAVPSPETVRGLLRKPCRGSFDCEIDQWCYNHQCDLPCPRLHCDETKPPDGVCVVRDHQPVCKSPAELEFEQEVRESGGCANSDDCGENEWCMYAVCEDACAQLNCAAEQDDFDCKVQNHHPKCYSKVIEAGEIPDVLVTQGGYCKSSFQCESHLNCLKNKCEDPCESLLCSIFKLDEPPANFTDLQKLWFDFNKGVNWRCLVWMHIAECVIRDSSATSGFLEVDSR